MILKSNQNNESEKFVPNSSYLELVQYNEQTKSLTISFKDGNQRRYSDISKSTYLSFKEAKSHGVYYSRLIKGSSGSVAVQSHNVGTRRSTQPFKSLNKQPGAKPYGSNALNRRVRDVSRGAKPSAGNIPTNISH